MCDYILWGACRVGCVLLCVIQDLWKVCFRKLDLNTKCFVVCQGFGKATPCSCYCLLLCLIPLLWFFPSYKPKSRLKRFYKRSGGISCKCYSFVTKHEALKLSETQKLASKKNMSCAKTKRKLS